MENKAPIGLEAKCWGCGRLWNVSTLPTTAKGVKCTCGAFVVTPSGKAMTRPLYSEFESTAPLLEETTWAESLKETKPKIILPGEE